MKHTDDIMKLSSEVEDISQVELPIRKLAGGVMDRALRDLESTSPVRHGERYWEVCGWFLDSQVEDPSYIFTFENVCTILGMSQQQVRDQVRKQYHITYPPAVEVSAA